MSMRIIDCHIHNAGILSDPVRLEQTINRCEIACAVLAGNVVESHFPSVEQVRRVNDATLAITRQLPGQTLGLCYLNPTFTSEAIDEMLRCYDLGMIGVKLWVAVLCTDPCVEPVVRKAIELKLPIVHHTWNKAVGQLPRESRPTDLAILAKRFPDAKLIMCHTGGDWEFGIKAVRDCPNVKVDFAGTVDERGAYETAIGELGINRVVFGSDMPYGDFFGNLGRVLQLRLSENDTNSILASNFESLFPYKISLEV